MNPLVLRVCDRPARRDGRAEVRDDEGPYDRADDDRADDDGERVDPLPVGRVEMRSAARMNIGRKTGIVWLALPPGPFR